MQPKIMLFSYYGCDRCAACLALSASQRFAAHSFARSPRFARRSARLSLVHLKQLLCAIIACRSRILEIPGVNTTSVNELLVRHRRRIQANAAAAAAAAACASEGSVCATQHRSRYERAARTNK